MCNRAGQLWSGFCARLSCLAVRLVQALMLITGSVARVPIVARTTELYGDRMLHYDTDLDSRFGTLSPAKVLAYSRTKY